MEMEKEKTIIFKSIQGIIIGKFYPESTIKNNDKILEFSKWCEVKNRFPPKDEFLFIKHDNLLVAIGNFQYEIKEETFKKVSIMYKELVESIESIDNEFILLHPSNGYWMKNVLSFFKLYCEELEKNKFQSSFKDKKTIDSKEFEQKTVEEMRKMVSDYISFLPWEKDFLQNPNIRSLLNASRWEIVEVCLLC